MGFFDRFKKAQPDITFEGGPGDSAETAIIIHGVPDLQVLLQSEVNFLTQHFGKRNEDWVLEDRITTRIGSRLYHVVRVQLQHNMTRTIYFDVTDFTR
ncbi:MAG: hypothetical protein M3347_00850 [Armatimonadota bacterium]|nr:hypothetical protein [Armatimonadota bacterium]